MLRFCSASPAIPDSTKAASAALRAALVDLDAAECRLVMFHVTMGHGAGAELRTLRALDPGARVIGCSCAGVSGDASEVTVATCRGVDAANSRTKSVDMASALPERGADFCAVMMIAPGIDVDMDESIAGVESVRGPQVESLFANLAVTMGQLVARTGSRRPIGVLHTDCGARGRLMLDHVSKGETVARMRHPLLGDDCGPWLEMYGFGEITFLGGHNLFHDYTSPLYVFMRGQA